MFTDLDLNKIDKLKDENINNLKIILANEATSLLHGKSAALKAEKTAKNIFEKRSIGDELPIININKNDISIGLNIVDLVVTAKLLDSKSEVRRTIKNKGIKINNITVEEEKKALYELIKILEKCDEKMNPEEIQTCIYTAGKENGYKENLRDWFKLIYQVVFGDENGPRMGFFISFFGLNETIQLIKNKLQNV